MKKWMSCVRAAGKRVELRVSDGGGRAQWVAWGLWVCVLVAVCVCGVGRRGHA